MSAEGYEEEDTLDQAWAKHAAAHPEVLASYRQQTGRWPMGHPNDLDNDLFTGFPAE